MKNPATGKCYFIITKSGKAVKTKSNIFSECFYILAMSELARATLDQKYKVTNYSIVGGVMDTLLCLF